MDTSKLIYMEGYFLVFEKGNQGLKGSDYYNFCHQISKYFLNSQQQPIIYHKENVKIFHLYHE